MLPQDRLSPELVTTMPAADRRDTSCCMRPCMVSGSSTYRTCVQLCVCVCVYVCVCVWWGWVGCVRVLVPMLMKSAPELVASFNIRELQVCADTSTIGSLRGTQRAHICATPPTSPGSASPATQWGPSVTGSREAPMAAWLMTVEYSRGAPEAACRLRKHSWNLLLAPATNRNWFVCMHVSV
jgi:hypothetical protein